MVLECHNLREFEVVCMINNFVFQLQAVTCARKLKTPTRACTELAEVGCAT